MALFVCDLDVGLKFLLFGVVFFLVDCSSFEFLLDLSSNRLRPDWFLSLLFFLPR